jgi:protein ImuA
MPPDSGAASARAEPRQATLAEIFCDRAVDAAATGFALAHLRPNAGPVLWIQDRLSRREAGRPYLAGMGIAIDVLYLETSKPVDVLWAMEQGLDCPDLSAVIAEIWGAAPAVDFTATKRLALRSEAHGVPAWLIRRGAKPDLSAARERWNLSSLPALPDPDDARAPGAPLWQADLFRARWRAPARWIARHDKAAHVLHMDHEMPQGMTNPQDHLRITA